MALFTGPRAGRWRERSLSEKPRTAGRFGWSSPSAAGELWSDCSNPVRAIRGASAPGPIFGTGLRNRGPRRRRRFSRTRAAPSSSTRRSRKRGHRSGSALERVADLPGFRDRMLDRFAQWTRRELIRDDIGEQDESRRLFADYRAILEEAGWEDTPGLEVWASRGALRRGALPRGVESVFVLADTRWTRARLRALAGLEEGLQAVEIALEYAPERELAEVYAPVEQLRQYFLVRNYIETCVARDADRPAGLSALESLLFRAENEPPRSPSGAEGIAILGAPEGEGEAIVAARQALDWIESGTDPSQILVLCRSWDARADWVVETLASWGIAAQSARARGGERSRRRRGASACRRAPH